jgi:hypothetical protein
MLVGPHVPFDYCHKRLKLAQLLGQLGVFLTLRSSRRPEPGFLSSPPYMSTPFEPKILMSKSFPVASSPKRERC